MPLTHYRCPKPTSMGVGLKFQPQGVEGGCDKILWAGIYSTHTKPDPFPSLGSCEEAVMGNGFEA